MLRNVTKYRMLSKEMQCDQKWMTVWELCRDTNTTEHRHGRDTFKYHGQNMWTMRVF